LTGLTGECFLPRSRGIHQTNFGRPLVRFFSLQRLRVVLRCRGRPGLATIPLRPFSFMQHRQESASGRRLGPCGFSLRVNRARHAPLKPRFTPAGTGHSPRSLFSRGVPLPVLTSPARLGRTYIASVRQRSWDFCTLRSIPRLRVPAFVSAVHPHMPFADRSTPLLFTVAGRRV
jgi:hypothetical protein